MTEIDENHFIIEGIRRYAPALETIAAFEQMLEDRLQHIVRTCGSPRFSASSSPADTGSGRGGWGHAIWAVQEGTLFEKGLLWLDLGLWWRNDEVAYYCGFVDEDDKPVPFEYTRKHPRIELKKWSSKPRLFMLRPADTTESLESGFKVILEELAASVK